MQRECRLNHDGLKVKTDSLQFNQDTKIAETAAPVSLSEKTSPVVDRRAG
jgi:hypothetical protein